MIDTGEGVHLGGELGDGEPGRGGPGTPRRCGACAPRPYRRSPAPRWPRPGLDPPREPTRHPHQVGVVQLGVAVAVSASPPGAEPTRVVPEREERVEHDPVHAVVAARHQIRIPQAALVIRHPLNLTTGPREVKLPEGAPLPGEVPAAA